MITFEQFPRLFGFGQNNANRHKIHYALHFDASKMRFMFPRNKRGSVGTTADLLPFYAYLTLFGRRSRKSQRALSRVIVMYPIFCVWLRMCWNHTFGWDKKHHPLRIKNDLRASVEERRATVPRVSPLWQNHLWRGPSPGSTWAILGEARTQSTHNSTLLYYTFK
jgi:hypothetical protein